jgi:hypothetical protein
MKTMFGLSLPPVVCMGEHVSFALLSLSVCGGVQHILYCVFCFVFLRLGASFSELSFSIVHSVFSNVYLD